MTYEKELAKLLAYLNSEQRNKELIELEYTDELKLIIGSEPIVRQLDENSKGVYFPGIGEKDGSEENFVLVRTNLKGKLVIKPKYIQEYLDSLKEKP